MSSYNAAIVHALSQLLCANSVLTCSVPFPRSPDKHMASNAYVLVNAALMVFFERAQSPSVAAVASDCLRQVLSSMSSGDPSLILELSQGNCLMILHIPMACLVRHVA